MTKHPSEMQLALLAGNDGNRVSDFLLNRHVRHCGECGEKVAGFVRLRQDVRAEDREIEDLNVEGLSWDSLAADMRANIHLGLEAGECVRRIEARRVVNPRLAVAFASLMVLLGAGMLLRGPYRSGPVPAGSPITADTANTKEAGVLESSAGGLEVRTGGSSFTLSNHHGIATNQTVSAQGAILASYVDGGAVTINGVSFE